jgi:ubiquinone/menaquinone biosynthesis C-methylase UbiE
MKVIENMSTPENTTDLATESTHWDHGSHSEFFDYYARQSMTSDAQGRFRRIRDAIRRVDPSKETGCDVADIGCNAGTQSLLWSELGHRVYGVDVNRPLLNLARQRAKSAGHEINFMLGSATSLPLGDASMDVCLAIELLEHVADWESCMREFTRILRPGGVLYLTTTNKLCPVQNEFQLPMYSWYPSAVKRHYERLSVTTRPELANYAKYPAVHWFSFYQLRDWLAKAGFESLDRFDIMDTANKSAKARTVVSLLRTVPVLRWFGHVGTSGTTIVGIKRK